MSGPRIMTAKSQNKGGRPILGKEAKQRYQVMLEPRTAEKLRKVGGGNLSAGIAHAATLTAKPPHRATIASAMPG